MYPIKIKILQGTLDVKEYDFKKNIFIGSNDKEYKIEDIEYFIVPKDEMIKMVSLTTSKSYRNNYIKEEV